jgi:DNA replicative helicase MCM subunit Mcm2 (Cdc46/Mcm family)
MTAKSRIHECPDCDTPLQVEYSGKKITTERWCPKCKARKGCLSCGALIPVLREMDMCGPCTFGGADSIDEGDMT